MCESTYDTLPSQDANQGDNTAFSTGQGIKIIIYIYI